MRRYLLIIEGTPGDFGAFFPDLPGVCVFADDKNTLLERATRAAEQHLQHKAEPRPSARSDQEIDLIRTRVQQSRPVFHTMICCTVIEQEASGGGTQERDAQDHSVGAATL